MMTKKHTYDTLIFDLDGTLLDTLQDLTNSVNHALEAHRYPAHTLSEVRMMVGNGIRKLIERAVPAGTAVADIEQVYALFTEYYGVHCNDFTAPYEGIMHLLQTLKNDGCKLAIVSNKADFAVKQLRDLHFDGIISVAIGEKEGVRRKPAPDTALTALAELGSDAAHSLYIGDSDVDIQTATNAGMRCISVTWGFRDRSFLLANGAETLIDTPTELLAIL